MSGWIGVALDGTLAEYNGWIRPTHIGAPIPKMVKRVKMWLALGQDVKLFTARIYASGGVTSDELFEIRTAINAWCQEHIGRVLPVTCTKDCGMVELWDARAVQVVPNTGERADGKAEL